MLNFKFGLTLIGLAVAGSAMGNDTHTPPAYLHTALRMAESPGQPPLTPGTTQPLPLLLETDRRGLACVVLANGIALLLEQQSSLRIDALTMTSPLAPDDWHDPQYEPSQSQLYMTLQEGRMALSRKTPNPTSTLVVETPLVRIEGSAKQWGAEVTSRTVRIFVIEGTLSFIMKDQDHSDFLQTGQTVEINRAQLVTGESPVIQRMTTAESNSWEKPLTRAALARRDTLFIPVAESGGDIEPRRVTPTTLLHTHPVDDHVLRR